MGYSETEMAGGGWMSWVGCRKGGGGGASSFNQFETLFRDSNWQNGVKITPKLSAAAAADPSSPTYVVIMFLSFLTLLRQLSHFRTSTSDGASVR